MKRIFSGWLTINTPDKDKEVIDIDRLAELMPAFIKRGGAVTENHTNRVVGKVLKWEKKWNEKHKAFGIWIEGKIFNGSPTFDRVWTNIKDKTYTGLSIGGNSLAKKYECSLIECFAKIKDLEIYEVSVVHKGRLPSAQILSFNELAKGDKQRPKYFFENFLPIDITKYLGGIYGRNTKNGRI